MQLAAEELAASIHHLVQLQHVGGGEQFLDIRLWEQYVRD